jgi:hypothetical protein
MTEPITPVLPAGFRIVKRAGEYIVSCVVCGTVWAIPVNVPLEAINGLDQAVDHHTTKYCAALAPVRG